jgi:hypothetical protein
VTELPEVQITWPASCSIAGELLRAHVIVIDTGMIEHVPQGGDHGGRTGNVEDG